VLEATETKIDSALCMPVAWPDQPLPANSLSLPVAPPNVTGIFAAAVVAVDSASGAVIAGTIGGWSCTSPGPAQFDGGYNIQKLPKQYNLCRAARRRG
jgi:hypothetical protein